AVVGPHRLDVAGGDAAYRHRLHAVAAGQTADHQVAVGDDAHHRRPVGDDHVADVAVAHDLGHLHDVHVLQHVDRVCGHHFANGLHGSTFPLDPGCPYHRRRRPNARCRQ